MISAVTRFSCPFAVHSTFLSVSSRIWQGEVSPQTYSHPHSTHRSAPHVQVSNSRPVLATLLQDASTLINQEWLPEAVRRIGGLAWAQWGRTVSS